MTVWNSATEVKFKNMQVKNGGGAANSNTI